MPPVGDVPNVSMVLEFDFSSKKKKNKSKKKIVDIEKLIAEDEKENQPEDKEKGEVPMDALRIYIGIHIAYY